MTTALALIGMLFLGLFLGVLVMSIRAAAERRDADEREARWRHCCRWLTEHIAKLEALQRAEQPRPERCEGIADDEHVIEQPAADDFRWTYPERLGQEAVR